MSRNKESIDHYSYRGEKSEDDVEEGHSVSKTAKVADRVTYLTRALVKNNVVG